MFMMPFKEIVKEQFEEGNILELAPADVIRTWIQFK